MWFGTWAKSNENPVRGGTVQRKYRPDTGARRRLEADGRGCGRRTKAARHPNYLSEKRGGEFKLMLHWAFVFLVIAVIAGLLGFTGVAGAAAAIAKLLFVLFLLVCLVMFAMALFIGKKVL